MRRQDIIMLVALGAKERTPRQVRGSIPGGRREARAEEGARAGAVAAGGRCVEEMSPCVRA